MTGDGSTWTNTGNLYVGQGGTATLTIEEGGSVSSATGSIASDAGQEGTVTVTGDGSSWTSTGNLYVGENGEATLTIADGGSVSNDSGYIGGEAGSEGTVTVTGDGSTWANTGYLYVGLNGAGTLTIADGGSVSNSSSYMGFGADAEAAVTVTGAGSTWTTTNDLYVGYSGVATLTIADGGVVNLLAQGIGGLSLASNTGSTGTLNIGAAAGETAVAAGTLNADSVSFGSGTGMIVFNHTDTDYDFTAAISGAGTIETYSGTTTLSGDNSGFDGTTDIYGGTLLVTDVLGGLANVSDGGTLGGTGRVGSTTVASGATIAPGLSGAIGTLNVFGSLTLDAGSTYAVDIDADTADLLSVSGTATINGGTVSVTSLDSETSYQTSQTYTILSAGSLSGSFDDTLATSAFLDVSTETVDNTVVLTVGVAGGTGGSDLFTRVASTGNQTAVAGALETLDQSGDSLSLYNDILVLDANDAREAFDQLSGDAYAGQQTALMQGSLAVNSTINGRIRSVFNGVATTSVPALGYAEEKPAATDGPFTAYDAKKTGRQADPERFAVWGSGFGTRGSSDGLDGASGTDSTTGGLLIGADGMVTETWRAGLFAGYSGSAFDTDNSSGNSDNYHLGAYAGTEIGRLAIRSGLSYTWSDVDTTRSVSASARRSL